MKYAAKEIFTMLERFIARIEEKLKNNSLAPVNIVVIGDSVSQGCMQADVMDFDNVYHAVLKKMLEKRYPKCTFNVINSAVGGESAPGGLTRLDRDVISHFPDLVIVGYCLNDSCGGPEALETYTGSMKKIISSIRSRINSDIILLTPNFMASRINPAIAEEHMKYTDTIIGNQKNGILKKYAYALKDLAAELDVPVADVYAKWEEMEKNGEDTTSMLCNGLNHPDIPRQKLIAETIFALMKSAWI